MVEQTLIVSPAEWQTAPAECIMAIKETMRKQGFDYVEVWAEQIPGAVHVKYCYPPRNVPNALYRGRT